MSFSKAGFKNSLTGLGSGGSSSGGGGINLKVDQIPTTSDYIVWDLPTGGIPIEPNTLVISINGLEQSGSYVQMLPNGYSFQWLSADPIFPDDDVRAIFII